MYAFNTHHSVYQPPGVSPQSSQPQFANTDLHLTLRQQPKEALVTTAGKEKARKPVDPPPIIQLHIEPHADPAQHFLQSPYLFMCTSLYQSDKDEPWSGPASKSLAGSLVSSLHRLKDVDNKDGGFFVFGDISVKVQGTFRLHFSLFDLQKDSNEVLFLGSITSEPFKVLLPKDFKGMEESTYLSRAFSDQGVRLRLRKEPRAMMSNKRSYPSMPEYSFDQNEEPPNKRFRKETPTDNSVFTPTYSSSYYPMPQTTALQQHSTAFSMTPHHPSSQYALYSDSILPSSAALFSQHRYSDLNPSTLPYPDDPH